MTSSTRPTLAAVAPHVAASPDAALVRAWEVSAVGQYRGPGMRDMIRAILLGSLCRVPINVMARGLPGTAKTAVAVEWFRCTSQRALDLTLSPWTEAAELLGPVDIAELSAGRFVRAASPNQPTLLDAIGVILDELPRAVGGIQSLCLRPLAERRLPSGEYIPAHLIIATANTRMTSEDQRALVDRFGLTVSIPRLMNFDDLRHVMHRRVPVAGVAPTAAPLPMLPPGLIAALRAQTAAVDHPAEIADAKTRLALILRQPAPSGASYPDVSERRWELASHLLCASATLDGRSSVDWQDLTAVLPMVLDDGDDSRPVIRAAIDAAVPKWVRALSDLDAACVAAVERARRVGGVVDASKGEGDAHTRVEEEFDALLAPLRPYGADIVARADARIDTARLSVAAAYSDGAATYAAARKARR